MAKLARTRTPSSKSKSVALIFSVLLRIYILGAFIAMLLLFSAPAFDSDELNSQENDAWLALGSCVYRKGYSYRQECT
jgi:flagellar basal body-associated protein FliL